MIDTWLRNDLKLIFEQHPVAVFIDSSGDAAFLLDLVKDDYTVHKTVSEVDELQVKYLIEREQPPLSKHLIYTQTPKDKLKFIREYCEINGCFELNNLQNYIKDKVHKTLNLNINLPQADLIAAAKVSVGKDRTFWMDISHKGASEIFDLEEELLPFLDDPVKFEAEKYDVQLRETFYRKVTGLISQEYVLKPVQTLANEIVNAMLMGLVTNSCEPVLYNVYCHWLDSVRYRGSFDQYLNQFNLPASIDIDTVHISHPFVSVDELWLKRIGKHLTDKSSWVNDLAKITQRDQNKQGQALGIYFWADIKVLLEFDSKDIAYLNSFSECVEFYSKHFYQLDTAIRHLYEKFLHKNELIEPLQVHYKELVSIFFDKWFKFFDDYQEQQTGILQKIIDENHQKVAVIVGDGVAYEMACEVEEKLRNRFELSKNILLADNPSETENNMSRIYMANGVTEKVQSKREKYLNSQNPDLSIEFIKLDEVNEDARLSKFLICTYKDIDDMGEKLQHKALKYFPETIGFFANKITLLLTSGYSKVYLITDHGFVLTGLLSESDKISPQLSGDFEKSERYIRTVEQQPSLVDHYIEVKREYEQFSYLYFSKTMNPFKTPGVYGFSHGGLSPQELVTPYFCWENTEDPFQNLAVKFQNKEDLKSVTGELYPLRILAGTRIDREINTFNRKVYLVFFSHKVQINKSDVFLIQHEELIAKEYTFDGHNEIEVQLLDAQTKEQLDSVIIKQNKDRDLGGLF